MDNTITAREPAFPHIVEGPYFERPPRWFKGRRWTQLREDLSKVEVLTLHQTATSIGVSERLLAAHGGDVLRARMTRLSGTSAARRGVPYHGLFSPEDDATLLPWHPRFVTHHGDFNRWTLGWAYIGKFPGDEVSPRLEAHFAAVLEHWLEMGVGLKYIHAHRQHASKRRNVKPSDPGPELWPLLERVASGFGIVAQPEATTGFGLTLPDHWHP